MRKLLALALFLTSATIFAQGTITGTVMDSQMNGPLPGATVMVVGNQQWYNYRFRWKIFYKSRKCNRENSN